jgi:hypothetical protein
MRVVNFGAVNVTGYASGALPAASLGCIYALDPTASRALQVDGSTATFNCGAVVESNSSTAFHMEGANTTYMGTNATLSVVGPSSCTAHSPALPNSCGFDLTGQTQVCPETGSCNSSTYPTSSGITSPGDPLSSIAAPSASGVTIRSSNSTTWTNNNPPTNNQFQPGVYCGGITMNSNGLTWTMQPGTYIMAGGGFTVQNGTVLNGTGVTIYNTSAASAGVSCSGGGTFQPVTMSGQVNVTLSAPTTGSLAGILFFQDRSLGTTSTLNQINGGSNTVLNGALYFKNSELLYSGNTSASGYTVLVADTININGNSSTTVNMVNSPLSSGGTVRAIPAISQ